jgi:hypothetical protein
VTLSSEGYSPVVEGKQGAAPSSSGTSSADADVPHTVWEFVMWLCFGGMSAALLIAGGAWVLTLVGLIVGGIAWSLYVHRVRPDRLPARRPLAVQLVALIFLFGLCALIAFGSQSHQGAARLIAVLFAAAGVAMLLDNRTVKRP